MSKLTSRICSVYVPLHHLLVTVFSAEPLPTHAAFFHVTHEPVRLALTRFYAMQSVVALWAGVLTEVAHQARRTDAMTVVLPTSRIVLALAIVLAVVPILSVRTDFSALGSGPSRRAVALARHI